MTQPDPDTAPDCRPVWLLDIDGVVNALSRKPVAGSFPADQWVQCLVRTELPGVGPAAFPILAAKPVLDFVAAVQATGKVDIRWHSTWREAAITDLAPSLGLPELPISVAPEWANHHAIIPWWKQAAAERVLAAGRLLVWTDDDINMFRMDLGAFERRADALLIAPDPEVGLTQPDLEEISRFLGL
jgi:hypothetical protein